MYYHIKNYGHGPFNVTYTPPPAPPPPQAFLPIAIDVGTYIPPPAPVVVYQPPPIVVEQPQLTINENPTVGVQSVINDLFGQQEPIVTYTPPQDAIAQVQNGALNETLISQPVADTLVISKQSLTQKITEVFSPPVVPLTKAEPIVVSTATAPVLKTSFTIFGTKKLF